jgi:hypothetical protein
MPEKVVKVVLFDSDKAAVALKSKDKFLETTVRPSDYDTVKTLGLMTPAGRVMFVPIPGDKKSDEAAAKAAAVRVLQEEFSGKTSFPFLFPSFGPRVDEQKMVQCDEYTDLAAKARAAVMTGGGSGFGRSGPPAPPPAPPVAPVLGAAAAGVTGAPIPTTTSVGTSTGPTTTSVGTSTTPPPDYLFCYKLNSFEKNRLVNSGGFVMVGINGLPMGLVGSDAWTAWFLTSRFPLFRSSIYLNSPSILFPSVIPYPYFAPPPIFDSFAHRLDSVFLPPLGLGYGYSGERERERGRSKRSSSSSRKRRSSSPRSRRTREKYLKYKQKYLQLKNSIL